MIPFAAGCWIKPYTGWTLGCDQYEHCIRAQASFDGANGATSVVDDVGILAWTFHGNAQLTTSNRKFGTAALNLDGNGDYVSMPDGDARLIFHNKPFTVEMYVRWGGGTPTGVHRIACSNLGGAASGRLNLGMTATGYAVFYLGASTHTSTTAYLADGNWHHIAVSAVGAGNTYVFVDGVLLSTVSTPSESYTTAFNAFGKGSVGSFEDWNGQIDEIRITQGWSRYSSTFTVPSVQYPAIGDNTCTGGLISTGSPYLVSTFVGGTTAGQNWNRNDPACSNLAAYIKSPSDMIFHVETAFGTSLSWTQPAPVVFEGYFDLGIKLNLNSGNSSWSGDIVEFDIEFLDANDVTKAAARIRKSQAYCLQLSLGANLSSLSNCTQVGAPTATYVVGDFTFTSTSLIWTSSGGSYHNDSKTVSSLDLSGVTKIKVSNGYLYGGSIGATSGTTFWMRVYP